MKKWEILHRLKSAEGAVDTQDILTILLNNRGLTNKKDIEFFIHPPDAYSLSAQDVGIDIKSLQSALKRIEAALLKKESIVVYADYDADGITAGAIMWQALYRLGAHVMPYIPHRVDEGYGLSIKGIDNVFTEHKPTLIITVDHGITAWEKVEYAKEKGIEIIITDHHVKPEKLPDATIVHTTQLAGAGVSWFVAKELLKNSGKEAIKNELLSLAAIGTIADMVPLTGANRAIAKHGLHAINQTACVGILALFDETRLTKGKIGSYEISHIVAPRLNAMGRIVHALDALRLLCTTNKARAQELAQKLGLTNRERQLLTEEMTIHAKDLVIAAKPNGKKLIFVSHDEYNQGVIGLVAGKLVEQYYLPSIVVSKGEKYSKASARSITGFNIIEAVRECSELLVDAGGHPMAAGFTVETTNLEKLKVKLEKIAARELTQDKLQRVLKIDLEIPLKSISYDLWQIIQGLVPFGIGNFEPVFASRKVVISDLRLVGREGKHIKLQISQPTQVRLPLEAIGFGMGELYNKLSPTHPVDIAYSIDLNEWNGKQSIQLKLKDIQY